MPSRRPFEERRVIAVDARTERMSEGAKVAGRLGLQNLHFEQKDIRSVSVRSHGVLDVIFFLGILYHLDVQDIFSVLQNVYEMSNQLVIIDTHVALKSKVKIKNGKNEYFGIKVREHRDKDSDEVRHGRLLASLDNAWSFWFTKESLFRFLRDIGFTSVCECAIPYEPFKPEDRITVIAVKGKPTKISTYPWVNDKPDSQIEELLAATHLEMAGRSLMNIARSVVKRGLRSLRIRRGHF